MYTISPPLSLDFHMKTFIIAAFEENRYMLLGASFNIQQIIRAEYIEDAYEVFFSGHDDTFFKNHCPYGYTIVGGECLFDLDYYEVSITKEGVVEAWNWDSRPRVSRPNPYHDVIIMKKRFNSIIEYNEYVKSTMSFSMVAGLSDAYSRFRRYCHELDKGWDWQMPLVVIPYELEKWGGALITEYGKGILYFKTEEHYIKFNKMFS